MKISEGLVDRYHIWDARKISELLQSEEVIDVTITSPPYWDLKDYGVESQIGFGQDYRQYLDDLEKVFSDVYSLTKRDGSLWIIIDTIKHRGEIKLLPFDLAQRMKDVGWILQDIIIWNKDKTLPWSHRGKLRNIFEYITFYSKKRKFNYNLSRIRETSELKNWWVRYPERYSPKGKAPARTWYIPIPRQGSWGKNWVRHFNPMPPELVERILLLSTNEEDMVLDLFAGSGVVLAQAHAMRRRYIGIDLNRDYKEMFEKHVLTSLCDLHKRNSKEKKKIEEAREIFDNLIRSLRKTKYPKQLVRLYEQKYCPVRLDAILALQGLKEDGLNIIFLFSHGSEIPSGFLSRVEELSRRPPLSKYGIEIFLETYLADVVSKQWLKDKRLDPEKLVYLYKGGRTYAWTKSLSVEELLRFIKNEDLFEFQERGYPPIFSDIEVKVDLHHPLSSILEENE
jgi:DNA modification methylase